MVPHYLVEGKPHGPNHAIDNGWETGAHVRQGTMALVGVHYLEFHYDLVSFTLFSYGHVL